MQTIDHITDGMISVTVGGKKRTLKFGMLTYKLIEEHGGQGSFENMGVIVWAGLMVADKEHNNDLPAGFGTDDALNWIDTMSEEDMALVFALQQKGLVKIKNVNGRVAALMGTDENGVPLPTGRNSRLLPVK